MHMIEGYDLLKSEFSDDIQAAATVAHNNDRVDVVVCYREILNTMDRNVHRNGNMQSLPHGNPYRK